MQQRLFILLVVCISGLRCLAFHIVGGELYYDYLGDDNYKITLKMYRDCSSSSAAPYDDPLVLYVYDADKNLIQSVEIPFPGSIVIDPDLTNPCMLHPPEVCVEEAIYTTTLNLPPSSGGYDLVYQRCCRNSSIININSPDATGATYWEHMPDPGSMENSSPRFTEFPPIVICGNYPISFNHAASDPDGDELVYELYAPYAGGSPDYPTPSPASPPPFYNVNYASGFSAAYPMDASPALSIDASTGLLTGTPTAFGQYVVGIAVKEYRDGQLIGTHLRDFQFNVTDCEPAIGAVTPASVSNCADLTIDFENDSYGTTEFYWDFGVDGINTDTSTLKEPTYTYPDTGSYNVMLVAFPGQTCSDTVYSTVHIYPHLIAGISYTSACATHLLSFNDASTTDHGSLTDWQWDFGDGNSSGLQDPVHIYAAGGTYTVTLEVENDVGCREEVNADVLVYPLPQVDFSIENDCLDQMAVFTDMSIAGTGYDITDLSWQINDEALGTGPAASYFFDTTGIYAITLMAETDAGCLDSLTQYLHIDSPLVASLTPDTIMCELDTLQLNAKSGSSFLWSPDYHISDTHVFNPLVYPDKTTLYTVIVSDKCSSDTGQVLVEVLPAPDIQASPADTTIYKNEVVQLYAGDGVRYTWTPAAYLSDAQYAEPAATPPNSITYTVYVVGANGCDNTDTVQIHTVNDCWKYYTVPNAFSPNGDGLNDMFSVVSSGDEIVPGFVIYNRWGEVVYQANDLRNGWDGNSNGKQQENGVYFFVLTLECDGLYESLQGMVTLLR